MRFILQLEPANRFFKGSSAEVGEADNTHLNFFHCRLWKPG